MLKRHHFQHTATTITIYKVIVWHDMIIHHCSQQATTAYSQRGTTPVYTHMQSIRIRCVRRTQYN